ncbi:MAG: sialate O-acetylesterase [Flavobacteriaceae bacterium]|nr:MAG: sialate O-acetylesterase [Flavobacteriaceae bacterium]
MKNIISILALLFLISCGKTREDSKVNFPKIQEMAENIPNKENVWVFIMAGQSNMAGRGIVAPQDTLPNPRIFSINSKDELILAKEPLHFYESNLIGLDCGYSFGKTLLEHVPDSVSLMLLPTAIGGSSVSQWANDSIYRNVQLLSNFKKKVAIGKKHGTIKAILWHQGESDANSHDIPLYKDKLSALFNTFRTTIGNDSLPIILGELGAYSKNPEEWGAITKIINEFPSFDANTSVIKLSDLKDKGDKIHFNTEGFRIMGKRYAEAYFATKE